MSRTFNQVSFQSIERITDALIESLSAMPEELLPLGRALANATEFLQSSAFLKGYGDTEEALTLLDLCRTNVVRALSLIDSITVQGLTSHVEGLA